LRAYSEMLAQFLFAARYCKERTMSLEQIKREFPFLWQAFPSEDLLSPDATINVRVSRLSLDAFELPMEEVRESDYAISRSLYVVDAKGLYVLAGEYENGEISGTGKISETIGDVLLHNFSSDGEEWARNVSYLIYVIEGDTAQWRRHKGKKKSHREWNTTHFEAVIFKMPKTKTLWQLIQRYRKNKRAALRR